MAKFATYKAREAVWAKRGQLKGSAVWLSEDFPPEVREERKALYPVYRAALKDKSNKVALRLDTLVLNGATYNVRTLDSLPTSLRPESLATVSSPSTAVFFTGKSPLSNFYVGAPFKLGGRVYSCSEQAYQHAKADHFGDDATALQILATKEPRQHYRLGQAVIKGFRDGAQWRRRASELLREAVAARISQDPVAAAALQATGDRVLGEASRDTFWGTGLSLSHRDTLSQRAWTGKNCMGQILMDVRKSLLTTQNA